MAQQPSNFFYIVQNNNYFYKNREFVARANTRICAYRSFLCMLFLSEKMEDTKDD